MSKKLKDKIEELVCIKAQLDLPETDLNNLKIQLDTLHKHSKKYASYPKPSQKIKSYLVELSDVTKRLDAAIAIRNGVTQTSTSTVSVEEIPEATQPTEEPQTLPQDSIGIATQDEAEEESETFLEACYNALCKFYQSVLEWIDYLTPNYFKTAANVPEETSELKNNSFFNDPGSEEGCWNALKEPHQYTV